MPDRKSFADRHIGPDADELEKALSAVGYRTLDALGADAVPAAIQLLEALDLPAAASEPEVTAELRSLAAANRRLVQMIGLGWHDTVTPPVIRRNVLEDPGWYTAYTPYQPEISQGRLEALLAFQTMIEDLTQLPVANASLLDEATACAEAVTLMRRVAKPQSDVVVVDSDCHPQSIAVVRTRCEPVGIDVVVTDLTAGLPPGLEPFGVLAAFPGSSGAVRDLRPLVEQAHAVGALVAVTADPLALCVLEAPGTWAADICVGSAQRFGVPLGFGGPHAGFMAVRQGLERSLPGRLVGVSVDADGKPALRLALQTREQHIRRERATSNICTAQVLLANIAAFYAMWHGPEGLAAIASRVHGHAATLQAALADGGIEVEHSSFFDTVQARVPGRAQAVVASALERGINLRLVDQDVVGVTCDEVTTEAHVREVVAAFGLDADVGTAAAAAVAQPRTTPFLLHPTFSRFRSETAMLRELRRLSDRDLALDRTMIPLGSCTMKLNGTTEMEPITWDGFAGIHPFAPLDQSQGYRAVIDDLERWLAEVTGYDAVSLQPNAGSQGELAGLLAIRALHRSRGDVGRDVCLIPSSAHGTNAASAAMAGMQVVVVGCDAGGNVDLDDLRAKAAAAGERLAALMVTYPSTHGVFEEAVGEVCAVVHDAGGQVYLDGANLNALVGLARPGRFGADVSHLNLHKTFCIPHGGGGPGVGPVAVRAHLAPFLPGHPLVSAAGPVGGPVISGAPWGSAGILPIPWAYLRLMGPDGLRRATSVAILSANYVAARLAPHFPVLYTGRGGLVAHECILDLRPLTKATGVTSEDVAKRLMDMGIHAPTQSFPVAGTLMVEPTESESLDELDRFCDAMVAIRAEIDKVADGTWPRDDNPLRNAPHTATMVTATAWDHPYTREEAAYPLGADPDKYWPPVRRLDGAVGDRNLMCSCPPMDR